MDEKEIKLKEKDMIFDCEMTENFLAYSYAEAILKSTTDQVRAAFISVFSDEEKIQHCLFDLKMSRGWQSSKEAKNSEIAMVKEQFTQSQNK